MASLNDKVALITGTASGQGREAALRFTAAGAKVVGCDVSEEGNAETRRLVEAQGGSIVTMEPVNLADPAEARQWVEQAAAVHGRIDVLYNNAARPHFADFETFPLDGWQFTIDNELNLVFYVTQAAWPYLRKQGGVVISTASTAGMTGSGFGGAAHAAAKAGVIGFTRHMAFEGAQHNIRVVSISPGVIETPGFLQWAKDNPDEAEPLLAKNLIPRFGRPQDIAGVALFLASDDAAYITGDNIVVDGGRTSW
ncbi:MAG: dehydrogenase [Porticoccaceae bacterium]|nr:dehydrogenase [Porticoccaceae bacterium]